MPATSFPYIPSAVSRSGLIMGISSCRLLFKQKRIKAQNKPVGSAAQLKN
jgi:hypothetical protein